MGDVTMMNWERHHYTKSQVRLIVYNAKKWKPSGRVGTVFTTHEVLRRRPRPKQMHPAYRRRRRKHPAFYSIRYIRNGKAKIHKLAWFRYRETDEKKALVLAARHRRHPSLRPVSATP